MTIQTFGMITEITGQNFYITGVKDTDGLKKYLQEEYPALAAVKFAVAVNNQLVTSNTALTEKSTVALLPPFSGG